MELIAFTLIHRLEEFGIFEFDESFRRMIHGAGCGIHFHILIAAFNADRIMRSGTDTINWLQGLSVRWVVSAVRWLS